MNIRQHILATADQIAKNKGQTAFLSGPISGIENMNAQAFADAQAALERDGFHVINPSQNFNGRHDLPYQIYMSLSLAQVTMSDLVVCLPGHENSPGSCDEKLVAWLCGVPIFELNLVDGISGLSPYDIARDLGITATREIKATLAAGLAKGHLPSSWRAETASHHGHRVARHAITAVDLIAKGGGLFQGESAQEHARQALCRAAMFCVLAQPKNNL
jgi:hypothetical protein